jgi:hypothetical protein
VTAEVTTDGQAFGSVAEAAILVQSEALDSVLRPLMQTTDLTATNYGLTHQPS